MDFDLARSLTTTLEDYDLRAVGLSVKDTDPQTIDVVAIRNGALEASETGSSAYGKTADPTVVDFGGTIFLIELAANEFDDWGTVAGHEAGHAFLSGPGTDDHSPDKTNLMYGKAFDPDDDVLGEYENYGDPKRLTEAQQAQVRADSGPQSSGTVLLQQ